MGVRYKLPFKACDNTSYEVLISRKDYTGEPTILTGAHSCFVVSGTDKDFIYTPVRTSTATITVLDSDLLLDLYSINNQYSSVKLYRDGVLEWTGYIKPEQFTQPYVPYAQTISVECISATTTLEHIKYKRQAESGYIKLFDVLRLIISSMSGGYRGIYIPKVYGNGKDALQDIILCEENFTTKENNLLEVLESICKFLNWTLFDIGGYLYFVDSDWSGAYRLYDEGLRTYTEVSGNSVLIQDIGYKDSSGNTLDIVPGYNKASVKSINNVFDEVIREEEFDKLKVIQTWEWNEELKEDALHVVRKYRKPNLWKPYYYDRGMNQIEDISNLDISWDVLGGVLTSENKYRVEDKNGEWVPKDKEFTWEDIIQVRISEFYNDDDRYKLLTVKGVNSVWKDGALGLNMDIAYATGNEMVYWANTVIATYYYFTLRIGEYYFNGESWVKSFNMFKIYHNVLTRNGYQPLESNLNALMPYRGLSGYVIPLPDDKVLKGELELTMYMNNPDDSTISGYFVKNFSLDYVKKEGVNDEGENGDRLYENVVNETYMSECEEITFDIGSYNADGATYSKALYGENFLTDNLYCAVVGENIRPEELMIRRIVNRYEVTKIKLTEAIRMTSAINPLTTINERSQLKKKFRMTSGVWDYEQGKLTVQMQEDI